MNKCSLKIYVCVFNNDCINELITALLNTAVCSKIFLVDESFREEASQLTFRSRLAGFCSIGATTEGYFRTDYSSKILLLLKLLFFIDVFELAISADYHPTSVVIVQRGYLEMLVNLNHYWAAIGIFNNRNLINKKCFYFTESNSVGIKLLFISAINVMVFFFFFFMCVISLSQKIEKLDLN